MEKLNITQIMKLAEKLEKIEWIGILLNLNNNGKIPELLNMLHKPDLVSQILNEAKKSKIR